MIFSRSSFRFNSTTVTSPVMSSQLKKSGSLGVLYARTNPPKLRFFVLTSNMGRGIICTTYLLTVRKRSCSKNFGKMRRDTSIALMIVAGRFLPNGSRLPMSVIMCTESLKKLRETYKTSPVRRAKGTRRS